MSGGVASFVCQATGDPKPRVTWNKKGKKVNSQRFEVSGGWGGGALNHIPLSRGAVAEPQDATRQPQSRFWHCRVFLVYHSVL